MTTLVTGANRGLGLEITRQLTKQNEAVVAVVRRASEALEATGAEVHTGFDMVVDGVVDALRERFSGRQFNTIVANAGVLESTSFPDLDFAAIERQFQVNAMGPLRLVVGLIPCLGAGAKVAVITSRMGSLADNSSGGAYGYRMSKAAVNMAAVSLAHDLRPSGIAVGLFHPGWVRTDMTGHNGTIDPAQSARGVLARIEALNLSNSGGFWHQNGDRLPW